MIFPGHGAGSLCGSGMAQRDQSTLGYERASNPFLKPQTEQTFIDTVLSTVPEFPDYYRKMKKLNAAGAPAFSRLPGGEQLKVKEFEARLQDTNAIVLDLRRAEAFGGAHIPRSINIGAGNNLSMWAAWVLRYDQPILLVAPSSALGWTRWSVRCAAALPRGWNPVGNKRMCRRCRSESCKRQWPTPMSSQCSMFAIRASGRAVTSRAHFTSRVETCRSRLRMCPQTSHSMYSAEAGTGPASPQACWRTTVAYR